MYAHPVLHCSSGDAPGPVQHAVSRVAVQDQWRVKREDGVPSASSDREAAAAARASSLDTLPFTNASFLATAYSVPGTNHRSATDAACAQGSCASALLKHTP